MKVKKGQLLHINHSRKGEFDAIAKQDFDTDEVQFYPVVLAPNNYAEGLNEYWLENEDIPCNKNLCTIS